MSVSLENVIIIIIMIIISMISIFSILYIYFSEEKKLNKRS